MVVRSLLQGNGAFDLQPKPKLRRENVSIVFITGGGTERRTERPIPKYQMHPQSSGACWNN
jgi:hypothetical protein